MAGMIAGLVVVYALFFLMCYLGTGGDAKNMNSYYSYPDAVQEKVRENEDLKKMIPKPKSQFLTFMGNLILFTFVFMVLGALLNLRQYFPALFYFLILGEGLNLFDLLVIDMCWWRKTSRTKFKAIPEKALYMDMKKHLESFGRAIPMFFCAAMIAAEILAHFPLS